MSSTWEENAAAGEWSEVAEAPTDAGEEKERKHKQPEEETPSGGSGDDHSEAGSG